LNGKVCANNFAVKAFEYRNGFDVMKRILWLISYYKKKITSTQPDIFTCRNETSKDSENTIGTSKDKQEKEEITDCVYKILCASDEKC